MPFAPQRQKYMRDLKLRIITVLLSDSTPDPRDIAIVALAGICQIFGRVLSGGQQHAAGYADCINRCQVLGELLVARELGHAYSRLQEVRYMDPIYQAISAGR